MPFATTTLNFSEPVWPVVADWFAGWVAIEGAASMVRVATLLVAVTSLASVTTARYSGEPGVAKSLMVKVVLAEPLTPLPSLRLVNVLP